ncbi:transcriptional regulator [Spongiactinospora rosea]|uniref:Transcriptional regulator n=1 Tax=Spongiactinospora rosea TaxID=2248750 RepID=A0A366LS93_9ACTN|nr:helix-turn-helix domain-containing protein [Spongiactinospora rosea]RBQ16806.1 transcriptional regulator [Spongiactinospora rosea]
MSTVAMTVPVTVSDHEECPATGVLRRVGDKWSVVLLSVLSRGAHGFNELDRSVEGLSRRMLTRTLRALEEEGLVSRTTQPGVAPRVDYALTELGRSFLEAVRALSLWAVAHQDDLAAARARAR